MFTLEVAVQTMAKNVEQFVLLFDASKLLYLNKDEVRKFNSIFSTFSNQKRETKTRVILFIYSW